MCQCRSGPLTPLSLSGAFPPFSRSLRARRRLSPAPSEPCKPSQQKHDRLFLQQKGEFPAGSAGTLSSVPRRASSEGGRAWSAPQKFTPALLLVKQPAMSCPFGVSGCIENVAWGLQIQTVKDQNSISCCTCKPEISCRTFRPYV